MRLEAKIKRKRVPAPQRWRERINEQIRGSRHTFLIANNSAISQVQSGMNSVTTRDQILESLKTLPPEATLEERREHLYFVTKLEQGLKQSEARELAAHDQVVKQFSR